MAETHRTGHSEFSQASVPAFWPMAMAADLAAQGMELYAKNLKFVEEEIKIRHERRPGPPQPTGYGWICAR